MKKLLLGVNIMLIGIIAFQACNLHGQQKAVVNIPAADTCFCKSYYDFEPKNRISLEVAKELADNYKSMPGKKYIAPHFLSSDPTVKNILDARSAWFDLDTLQAFICQIRKYQGRYNCQTKLGIRIYYGKYPNASRMRILPQLANLPASYAGHHTVFFVPTYNDGLKHVDFDPLKPFGDATVQDFCHPWPLKMFNNGGGGPSKHTYILMPSIGGIGGEDASNHGSMIPPDNSNGSSF